MKNIGKSHTNSRSDSIKGLPSFYCFPPVFTILIPETKSETCPCCVSVWERFPLNHQTTHPVPEGDKGRSGLLLCLRAADRCWQKGPETAFKIPVPELCGGGGCAQTAASHPSPSACVKAEFQSLYLAGSELRD